MRHAQHHPGHGRCRRIAAIAAVGAIAAAAPTSADPADPYVDKYGDEICAALDRNPSHREILKAIATVRDYVRLSDEDAEIVVVDSVSRRCPQYTRLIPPPAG